MPDWLREWSGVVAAPRRLADLVFPPVCVACGGLVEEGAFRHLCRGCADAIDYTPVPTAVRFAGPARAMLLALKYHGARHVAGDLLRMCEAAAGFVEALRGAALVPVPLHPRRERERGFNQSWLLARGLAARAGGGARALPLLRRVSDGPPQASLGREQRAAGVKNAFALVPGAPLNPRLRHVIIDDIATTGSTLESCARALRRAGLERVEAAAVARG